MQLRKVIALTVLAAALGACGNPTEAASSAPTTTIDPDTPVSSTPGSDDGTQPSGPRHVEPKPGQADVRPIGWQKAAVGADDRTVTIHFTSGVEPCYVLDHIDVRYGAKRVEITLFEGHEPSDEDVACIEIAEFKVTEVQLDEPLAGRKLVDGAR
ncbi:MAG: hypothetical protein QOH90_628 [Actinomycetota bacterium]|nr:hypothetical protein [Actinomycetota bacterium]